MAKNGHNAVMPAQPFETSCGAAVIRVLEPRDLPAIQRLQREALHVAWNESRLLSQLAVFPRGQVGVEHQGELIAIASTLIVDLGRDEYRPHTLAGITDDGYFNNHNEDGDTLYCACFAVSHRFERDSSVSGALVAELREVCKNNRLRRILLGCVSTSLESRAVSDAAQTGHIRATTTFVSQALEHGFVLSARLPNYVPEEPGKAALLEWRNPDGGAVDERRGSVRVALVQHQMRAVNTFQEFAEQVTYFVDVAHGYRADFVVFPEFTSMQLLSMEATRGLPSTAAVRHVSRWADQIFGLFSRLARRHGVYIIGGSHPVVRRVNGEERVLNVCPIACPDGRVYMQPKLHITPWEREAWGIAGGEHLAVLQTPKAKIGVLICYDSEFPEATRHLADEGLDILFVPYCTDDRQGYVRVRWCCQARAVENQIYVAATGLVGNLPGVTGMDVHYGRAAVFTPSDFSFARDGIHAEADANVETLLVAELDLPRLHHARQFGSVRPRLDRRLDLFPATARFADSSLPEYEFAVQPDDRE